MSSGALWSGLNCYRVEKARGEIVRRGRTAILGAGLTLITLAGCGATTIKTVTHKGQPSTTSAVVDHLGKGVYRVASGAMEPTLSIGQYVRSSPLTSVPAVGDIVLFHPPSDAGRMVCGRYAYAVKPGGRACSESGPRPSSLEYIKRIVAGPGDSVAIIEGHVIRNGVREPDAYIKPCRMGLDCNFPQTIKIPPGHWYMLGDNRGESNDSRFWGPVATGWIMGIAHRCFERGDTCVAIK